MPQLTVELLNSNDQVVAHRDRWNQLAGNRPLQRWEWLGAWAQHYCVGDSSLLVLVVRDADKIIALAPLCIMDRPYFGRTICFLGGGKACTDHMTFLVEPGFEDAAVETIANWLVENRNGDSQWNHCQLIGVDADDAIMQKFNQAMTDVGCHLDTRPGQPCYGVDLPDTIEEYTSRRSKNGKRDTNKIKRQLNNGTCEIFTPTTRSELEQYWDKFVELHQMRRDMLGEDGCFAHSKFGEFLWDASCRLLDAGLLRMPFVLIDGEPVSVQYSVVAEDRWLFYQSGMNPGYQKNSPGQVVLYHAICESIQSGHKYFDMMRGDEPYKLRWRAEMVSTTEIRIAAPQIYAQLKQRAWQWRKKAKAWAKERLGRPA